MYRNTDSDNWIKDGQMIPLVRVNLHNYVFKRDDIYSGAYTQV